MFPTLYAKTFAILGTQLFITWAATVLVIRFVARRYHARAPGITARQRADGSLDFDIHWRVIKPYFYALLLLVVAVFIVLYWKGRHDLAVGIPLFSLWSILTGIELALALLSVDENLGGRVLAITVSATVGCALVGVYAGIDFGFLGTILFFGLMLLLSGNVIRLFLGMQSATQRGSAFFGVLVFIGYLLFDFNHLSKLADRADANTWPVAMELAINIYLDVINLFLQLLAALSDS